MSQIDVIMSGLDTLVESEVTRLALDLVEGLVLNTPVDLGWARAGWVPTIGTPYTGGADLRPTPISVARAATKQNAALASILGYKLREGPIFVTNNVRYIEVLNEGHSRQAPAGYVQATIAATVAFGGYGHGTETVQRSSFTYRPGK